MQNLRQLLSLLAVACTALLPAVNAGATQMPEVTWDRLSLMIDGRRVCPVMGEIHYSRVPADEWQREVRMMKQGGVTMIATYVFWNHIEEQEGRFRWDGQRDLRRFLEVCRQEGLPVVLRIGPFCHGEVRNGGLPDWLWSLPAAPSQDGGAAKPVRLRSTDPQFLFYVDRLYRQIYSQIIGLQWKDGGPLVACQFDNEYRGSGDYLMALKQMALRIGFDLPFYTRTGWPELSKPVPFGEMLPLYGDYADGFWEKSTGETVGSYYKAFQFKPSPLPSTTMGEAAAGPSRPSPGPSLVGRGEDTLRAELQQQDIPLPSLQGRGRGRFSQGRFSGGYPYFTCELGGGMATAYHRRPYIYADDAYALALVKLGSGSNLLGYYMYHGGTNPESTTGIALNETQRTLGTANNDLPVKTYDFQAPLGEFGQTYPQYYRLRPLHLFMADYGELLAPMEAQFPVPQDLKKGDDTQLRWAVRQSAVSTADGGQGAASGFIFVNNYERLQNLSAKRDVQLAACGVSLPRLTIPAGCMAIFPVNVDGIRYATGQLVARRDGNVYMMQVKGLPTTICMQDGKTLRNVRPRGTARPVYKNIYLLTQEEAEYLFLPQRGFYDIGLDATCTKVKEAGPLRQIVKGRAKVAEAPTEDDWQQAAVYRVTVPKEAVSKFKRLLSIEYQGDCARLYAVSNGEDSLASPSYRLIADNFQYGRPFLYGLWRLPEGVTELELRILPLQAGVPVYLPREADKTPGESVKKVEITYEGLIGD